MSKLSTIFGFSAHPVRSYIYRYNEVGLAGVKEGGLVGVVWSLAFPSGEGVYYSIH